MANHKSAIKRARQNETKRIRNKSVKTRFKNITKQVTASLEGASKEDAMLKLNVAKSTIDKAAQKGVIHRKTAARKISRLSKRFGKLEA